MKQRIKRHLEN